MSSSAGRRPGTLTEADLDSRFLRYFRAVVHEGSIRGAAEVLHVAASAISRQISELEGRLGVPLLERLPRGVVPTAAGQVVAEHARQQAEDAETVLDRLARLHNLRQGAVRIRCGEGFVSDLLDNGLPPFSAAHPDVRCRISLGATAEILEAVAGGSADIGLAYGPPARAGLRSAAIARQPLVVLVAPGHRLSGRRQVTLRALAAERTVLLSPEHGVRQLLARAQADQGVILVPHVEADSIDVVRRVAIAGAAVALLPQFAASAEIAQGRLVAVPVADTLLNEASAHLLVRSQRRLPAAVGRLVECLASRMRAFVPPPGGSAPA